MKKVGKYLIITLLLLLGLFCVAVLYLFFIPDATLFNITYINKNEKIKSDEYEISTISDISLNSRSYSVNVLSTDAEKISLEVKCNTFGFVHVDNQNIEINASIRNNVLTLDVKEPHGFSFDNSSSINLFVPKSKTFNLNLSNKNAVTRLKDEKLTINNLLYSTEHGDLHLTKASIAGSLKLDLNASKCYVESTAVKETTNVELKLSTGKFLASEVKLNNITVNKNDRGVIEIAECSTLRENTDSAGGQITIKKISYINVKASDTIITIDEVLDGAIIDLVGSGKFTVKSLSGTSSISTKSGNINIENCLSSATLHSDDGDITVKNAMKTISTKTNYGEINITFGEDAGHYSELDTDKSRALYATIKDGKLTATGVEHLGSSEIDATQGIVVTGNGRVNITMDNVLGANSIVGKDGNINLIVNHESIYKLTTNPESATTGNVKVNLTQISEYGGYSDKSNKVTFVNCTEATYDNKNSLIVSTTTGDMTIIDTELLEKTEN